MNKWIKDLTPDDMPNNDLALVANLCGVDVAIKLIDKMGGIPIYVPNRPTLALKNKYILKKFDGKRETIKELALECEVSEVHIYNLLRKNKRLKEDLS